MKLFPFNLLLIIILEIPICIGQEIKITFVGNLEKHSAEELALLENKFRNRKISIRSIYSDDKDFFEFNKNSFSDWNIDQNTRFNDFNAALKNFSGLIGRNNKIFIWPTNFKTYDLSRVAEDLLKNQIRLNKKGEIPLKSAFFKEIRNSLKNRNDVEILYLKDTVEFEFSCIKILEKTRDIELRWDSQVDLGSETYYMMSASGARFYKLDFNGPLLPLDYKLTFQFESNYGPIKFSKEILSSNVYFVDHSNFQGRFNDAESKIFLNKSKNKIEIYISLANLVELLEIELGKNKKLSNIQANSVIHTINWHVKLESFKHNCKDVPVIISNMHQLNLSCTDPE